MYLSAYASSETIAEVSAEMKQYMLVMYNNVTETADEAMSNIACEIYCSTNLIVNSDAG